MWTGTLSTYESGVDLVVEWKIEKFFNLPKFDGVFYYGPEFSFGVEAWFLVIYPNGSSENESSGHVDLVLCKCDSDRSIKQPFSLSLKTAKGEKYNEQNGTKDFEKWNDYHSFNRFIQRSDLTRRSYELVPDGVLTVVCTMKSSTSAGSASNTASTSDKCCHCKITFNAQNLSSHQKRCMHRPIKCPDCLEVVVLQKWLDEHECQKERSEDYNCREKLLMFLCIASILIAVVTGCILAYSKTPLSSTHPCGDLVMSNEQLQEKIAQLKAVSKTLKARESELNAIKKEHGELQWFYESIASKKNKLEQKAVNKIQTSENNKANNRSVVVGSKEFQASSSNETSTTDIKKWESVNKTLATEMNKTDQSEIAGYDIPETSAANETDTAETDESEPLPQPVLMVTEVGSTYLEVAWVLPEESKTNAAHIHYIVHFRKYGAQWQEVSFLNASRTSYSLTNLNPGMSYQIYVMSVDSRFSRPGEIATVRTSDKFVNHSPSKGHGKQLLVYSATIIILVIAIAGVYNYSKTSFSALHPYGEEVKEVSTAELNKADTLEVSLSNEIKASGSNQTGIAKTENLVSSINAPEERDWMTDVKDFLIEGTGVDVTFELETPNGKVEFFAHQLILALRSPYFADEFYGKGKNNGHLRISLKGIDPKAFKEMLRYCYDNKPRLRTTEDACVLFKVASDFKMLNLQKLCRTFIRDAEIDP